MPYNDNWDKTYREYIKAKADLKYTVVSGSKALGWTCFFCVPIIIWCNIMVAVMDSIPIEYFSIIPLMWVVNPMLFDLCLYIRYRTRPEDPSARKDDDTNPPKPKYVPPIASTIVWVVFTVIMLYASDGNSYDDLGAVIAICISVVAVFGGIWARHRPRIGPQDEIIPEDSTVDLVDRVDVEEHHASRRVETATENRQTDHGSMFAGKKQQTVQSGITAAEKQRRVQDFYNKNKDNTDGKYKYVYCVGSIDSILEREYHNFGAYRTSYAIFRVPEKYRDLAEYTNVAVGKRFFKSTEDSDMIITSTFYSDEESADVPLLTRVREPHKIYPTEFPISEIERRRGMRYPSVSQWRDNGKFFQQAIRTMQPFVLIAKELREDLFCQANTTTNAAGINSGKDVYPKEFNCVVPKDIPIDDMRLGSLVLVEDVDGSHVLCFVNGYQTIDKREGAYIDSRYSSAADDLIRANTSENDEDKDWHFNLARRMLELSQPHFRVVKALYKY